MGAIFQQRVIFLVSESWGQVTNLTVLLTFLDLLENKCLCISGLRIVRMVDEDLFEALQRFIKSSDLRKNHAALVGGKDEVGVQFGCGGESLEGFFVLSTQT